MRFGLIEFASWLMRPKRSAPNKKQVRQDYALISRSTLFDAPYYLDQNPDVAYAGVDPLLHFCENGWREFRRPSQQFDCRHYVLAHFAHLGRPQNPLAHYLREGRVAGLAIYSREQIGAKEARRLAQVLQMHLQQVRAPTPHPEMLKLMADAFATSGMSEVAGVILEHLVSSQPGNGANYIALAHWQLKQLRLLDATETIQQAIDCSGERLEWLLMLADARERLRHFPEAAKICRRALALQPHDCELHYRHGFVLQLLGKEADAQNAFNRALHYNRDELVSRLGVGSFHQAYGRWQDALLAYRAREKERPADAELQYRIGLMSERLFDWPSAEQAYATAIRETSQSLSTEWHFRLGVVLERQERFAEAASSYRAAVDLAALPDDYWLYRLGHVLADAGDYENSCKAFERLRFEANGFSRTNGDPSAKGLTDDAVHAHHFMRIAQEHRQTGDLARSIEAYRAAVARAEAHQPAWFFELAQTLVSAGRLEEACHAFKSTRVLQRPHNFAKDEHRWNTALWSEISYLEYSECLPLRSDVILYESFAGRSLSCNPLAIFRALVDDPDYSHFLHVWVLNDKSRIPADLCDRANVAFVSKGSDGYLRHLATAKFLINNNGFLPYFTRRHGQKYLETWHGTPLKTLGKDQKYKFYDHKRAQRNFLQASHLITPNPHTTDVILDSYDIRQLATAKVGELGYPRLDATLNAADREKRLLMQRLGLEAGRPVVLYAPTWRGTPDDLQFDADKLNADLAVLSSVDCQLIFRGHNFMEALLATADVDCKIVPADIDTNALLPIVDVLITDYSSIFFDFLPLNRPILFYAYDEDAYERERGLYFSMAELPGATCCDIHELRTALAAALHDGYHAGAATKNARAVFNPHDDGKATERAIAFFFDDREGLDLDYRTDGRHAVLFGGGAFKPNGITASFVNLVNAIDTNKVDITIGISPDTVSASAQNVAQFRKMGDGLAVVPRHGHFLRTPDEIAACELEETGVALNATAQAIVKKAYTREFKRIFGHKIFDTVISFAGYDAFWTGVLVANNLPIRKVIYLHSDMYSEYLTRAPELGRMFRLYGLADKLISVSDLTSTVNQTALAERYDLSPSKFDHCDNLIDATAIRESAHNSTLPPEHEALFSRPGPVFLNIGRLSVEKDHEKLIRAFTAVVTDRADAQLVILGDGPLQSHLHSLVVRLKMSDHVHLLGHCANPFAYLRRAACFVLSSNHEGQPMTLLEALVLAVPIIATDIAGNRSVLEGYGGNLVENSIDGLIAGMRSFLSGDLAAEHFDAAAYRDNALAQFYERALGLE